MRMQVLEGVFTDLKSKGVKLTLARKSILEVLFKAGQPISAEDILSQLKKKKSVPDRATVYRQVNFLNEANIISELDFGDGKKRYEFDFKKHHHHLICLNCGKIEDFTPLLDLEKEEVNISKNKGFKVSYHSLEFFGTCKDCLANLA